MSLPRMSLHIGDYKKDTGHLRAAGHGAYLLLIMHYWATGGLPDDDEQLASIACMTDQEWEKWRPIIRKLFGDGWRHKRIDEELAAAQAKYERRAGAGKKGGEARAAAKQCSSNATPEPKQPITLTDKEEDGGEDARATPPEKPVPERKPLVSPEAFALTEQIAVIAGVGPPDIWPPGWCGAPMRVHAMLAEGWRPEIMLAEARATMAKKRDGPPDTVNYFEKPFARAHAQQAAPLPVVNARTEPEVIHAGLQQSHAGGYGQHRSSENLSARGVRLIREASAAASSR